jgi:uncharacterized protein
MKILIFSDIHGNIAALKKIMAKPADLYIAAGDLAMFRRHLDTCGEVLKPLGEKLWLLPGNHETHDDTRLLCGRFGFVDFHRQTRTLESQDGVTRWAGLGYSNITPFKTPGEYTEEQIGEALAEFDGAKPQYLVVHFPPHDTKLDEYVPGKHAGSPTLRKWVARMQPGHLFCGHILETAGLSDQLGATRCFNVGPTGYLLEI